MRRRQSMQQGYLDLLVDEYGEQMTITHVPLFAREIKGVTRLRKVERVLFPL
ncbi:MAG: ArsA-related P-loop ATPase [Anaerolineae bacterium]